MAHGFRRVLVAIDGSDNARQALRRAIEWAEAAKPERFGIIHVRPTLETLAGAWGYHPEAYLQVTENMLKELEQRSQELLNEAEAMVKERIPDMTVEQYAMSGPVVAAILDIVRSEGYDLLIMGSRGLGRAKGLLLGSVSQAVLGALPCSVLVVKAEDRGHS